MCVQSKHCNCKSFAHNAQKGRCLIANRFSGLSPYDALLERRNWNYYHLSSSSDGSGNSGGELNTGCNRHKRPALTHIEGIRLVSTREADVVEVMVNGSWGGVCDDDFSFNEAHVVCR